MSRTETKQVTYYDLTGNSLVVIDGIVYVTERVRDAADKASRMAEEAFGTAAMLEIELSKEEKHDNR